MSSNGLCDFLLPGFKKESTINYIHLGDFEKFVRNRFKNIIGGKGSTVPRTAVKIALDDIFKEGASQPSVQTDAEKQGIMKECGAILTDGLCPYDLDV